MVERDHWKKESMRDLKKGYDNSKANEEDVKLTAMRTEEESYALFKLLAANYNPIDIK